MGKNESPQGDDMDLNLFDGFDLNNFNFAEHKLLMVLGILGILYLANTIIRWFAQRKWTRRQEEKLDKLQETQEDGIKTIHNDFKELRSDISTRVTSVEERQKVHSAEIDLLKLNLQKAEVQTQIANSISTAARRVGSAGTLTRDDLGNMLREAGLTLKKEGENLDKAADTMTGASETQPLGTEAREAMLTEMLDEPGEEEPDIIESFEDEEDVSEPMRSSLYHRSDLASIADHAVNDLIDQVDRTHQDKEAYIEKVSFFGRGFLIDLALPGWPYRTHVYIDSKNAFVDGELAELSAYDLSLLSRIKERLEQSLEVVLELTSEELAKVPSTVINDYVVTYTESPFAHIGTKEVRTRLRNS